MTTYYEWDFFTRGVTTFRACHRGPMIDVEVQMAQPFVVVSDLELHRTTLLRYIVDSTLPAVQTRECVLRVMNGDLGPIIARLYTVKADLQTRICEKRNALDIDTDISAVPISYNDAAYKLRDYAISQQTVDLILNALDSKNAVLRVAGRCAVILVAAYIELDA